MNLFRLFFTVCFAVFLAQPTRAQFGAPVREPGIISECDYCGCAQGVSPLQTGSTGIRYDVGSLYLGAPYNGAQKLVNPSGQYETFLTNRLTVFYKIGESPFVISGSLPYVVRQSHEPNDVGGLDKFEGSGIGDISAMLRFNHHDYIGEAMIIYTFSAGVKLPTGKNDIVQPGNSYLDPDLQPGTGTTDVIFGTGGLWSLNKYSIYGSLGAGVVTGQGAPSDQGYHKYGNYLLGELTGSYRFWEADATVSSLAASIGLGFETRAKETLAGADIQASGGNIVYLVPGLKYLISQGFAADAAIQIPLHQYLGADPANDGYQLGMNYRFLLGVQYSLTSGM